MMENKTPDFYLIPTESGDLKKLRACWFLSRLKDEFRDDYMLVRINPSLIGQKYGLGDKNIDKLILATRHKDFSLFPIVELLEIPLSEWPLHVYVARILDESVVQNKRISNDKQTELIAWGAIYRSNEQAKEFQERTT